MGWVYILVRTYPFWAIPMGAIMLTIIFSKKGKKISGKQKMGYMASGIALIASGILFVVFGGPMKAVPVVHEIIQEERR